MFLSDEKKGSNSHTTLSIPQDLLNEMDKFVGTQGFRSKAEIAKQAIREYLDRQYLKEGLPPFERINADASGIKIFDRKLIGNKLVHVIFTPKGIYCDYHETDDCEHVKYALEQPDVKQILKEKKKEGWKLPDV